MDSDSPASSYQMSGLHHAKRHGRCTPPGAVGGVAGFGDSASTGSGTPSQLAAEPASEAGEVTVSAAMLQARSTPGIVCEITAAS